MARYEVLMQTRAGKIKHVIRAESRAEAVKRCAAAHPEGKLASAKEMIPIMRGNAGNLDAARKASETIRQEMRRKRILGMLDHIPPEGITCPALSRIINVSRDTAREWSIELEAEGKVTRELTRDGIVLRMAESPVASGE